jgi:hypothetical protein
MPLTRHSLAWITGSSAVAKLAQQRGWPSYFQGLLIVLAGALGCLLIGYWAAWYGPDPSQVIRASSPAVPDFSQLSEAEVVEKLEAILSRQPAAYPATRIHRLAGGRLRLELEYPQSGFRSTRTVPFSELDRFLYGEQAVKGKRTWAIHVYCANSQKCITGTNSRTAGEFNLNADGILYLPPEGDVKEVLGLFNRFLALYGAKSTIDVSKNTIRISEEYWQQSVED